MVSRITGRCSMVGTSGLGEVHGAWMNVWHGECESKASSNKASDKGLACHSVNYVSKPSAKAV